MANNTEKVDMSAVPAHVDKDAVHLAKLGYRQEFHRKLGVFENWAASFSTIAFVNGLPAMFGYALITGGPLAAWINWILIGGCAFSTALVLAEICSAMPTAGGIYFWSARLGGDNYGPFLSWLTAWWSWAGWLFTFPAMCHNATTFLVSAIMILNPDYDNALWKQFLLDCVWAITTTAMNVISEDFMKWFYRLSSGLNLFVFLLFLTWLPAKVPKWQSGSIMLQFNDYTGATQYFGSEANAKAYVWLIALLFPAWTFYGYDASAHVAEETENAAKTASRGMYTAVGVAFIGSFALLLLLLFSIQDLDEIISYQYPQPIATLFVQTVGREGAATFMVFLFLVSWSCTVACAMSISRITYAVSRDQILPFSKYWHHMSAAKMPVRAQWLCCALTIILLLPVVGSPIAFYALASTATIAVDTSYIIPILGKLTVGRASFKPGEWNLGKLSVPLGIFVCIWISLLFVCLCLPQLFVPLNEEGTVYGVTAQVFNFAPVMIGAVTLISTIGWVVSARKWFKGPQRLVSEEEAAELERQYRELHGGEHMPHDKVEFDHSVMEGLGAKA